jgi:hypothetical protein
MLKVYQSDLLNQGLKNILREENFLFKSFSFAQIGYIQFTPLKMNCLFLSVIKN